MNKPKTIDECMIAITEMLPTQEVNKLVSFSKEELIQTHHGLGQWIRNNWGLWAGGDLKNHMSSLGFTHPDDMSSAIIDEYWNRSNNKPSELAKYAEQCKEFWDKTRA